MRSQDTVKQKLQQAHEAIMTNDVHQVLKQQRQQINDHQNRWGLSTSQSSEQENDMLQVGDNYTTTQPSPLQSLVPLLLSAALGGSAIGAPLAIWNVLQNLPKPEAASTTPVQQPVEQSAPASFDDLYMEWTLPDSNSN